MPTKSRTIESYAASVAAPTATPGGGSVAAIAAALAAGLSEMVCGLTLAGAPSDPAYATLIAARNVAAKSRTALLDLAQADETAYGNYRRASAMPKTTPAQKAERTVAMQAALTIAADVPLQCATTILAFLGSLDGVAEFGTRHALSDIATACMISESALKSALLNVRVNAKLLKDVDAASALLLEADRLEFDAQLAAAKASATIASRSAPPIGT
ncbi:MAG: cyclodeaminase/cyclohydrolase family protein [Thermomicrobiales bacterium]